MPTLRVWLTQDEANALRIMAERDIRDMKEEARYLILLSMDSEILKQAKKSATSFVSIDELAEDTK